MSNMSKTDKTPLLKEQELCCTSSATLDTSSQYSQPKIKGDNNIWRVFWIQNYSITQGATLLLSFMYTGMTYYEGQNGDCIVRFSVMKDLDALLMV